MRRLPSTIAYVALVFGRYLLAVETGCIYCSLRKKGKPSFRFISTLKGWKSYAGSIRFKVQSSRFKVHMLSTQHSASSTQHPAPSVVQLDTHSLLPMMLLHRERHSFHLGQASDITVRFGSAKDAVIS